MPSVKEALGADLSAYAPIQPVRMPQSIPSPFPQSGEPVINSMLRCPLPPLWNASPDSLRQFYLNGQVPQKRLWSPQPVVAAGSVNVSNTLVAETGTSIAKGSGTSGSGTSSGRVITAQQASIVTNVLNPGQVFQTTLKMAKAFQLLSVSVNAPCRIQLYGTVLAQTGDSARALDTAPPAGTMQNIICDLALDTSPYQWGFQNRVGANGDNPQSSNVYVSLTNIGSGSVAITLTILYASLES